MSSITIEEAIITIASIIAVTVLTSVVLSNFARLQANYITSINTGNEIISTKIKIIFVTNTSDTIIKIWVKNIGSNKINQKMLNKIDIFLGKVGNYSRINSSQYSITIVNNDNDTYWELGETIEITVNYNQTLTSGDYYVKIILYNGVKDEAFFSI